MRAAPGFNLLSIPSVLAVCLLASIAGCVTLDSYPDPAYTRYSLTDHPPGSLPPEVALEVAYRVNDQPAPQQAARARDRVIHLLSRASMAQVALPERVEPGTTTLRLRIDQRFDPAQARNAGASTGASLGAVDNRVRDEFSIAVELVEPGQTQAAPVGIYEHAIVTDVEDISVDVPLQEYADALDAVLDDALARFVADRQRAMQRPSPVIVLPEGPDLSEDGQPDL
ncbi:MAG: hypothetical protein ABF271_02490 [Abyssibacter sp.]|uniref:hypothetical protein n=1 Tax=Abyssibacter sp. TaxID=2320200 RepID=UPI00321AFAD8